MNSRYFCSALLFISSSCAVFAQDCPKWGDNAGALQFLRVHKTNGVAADPECVSTAFATLSHDKSNAEALVRLLDFQRSTENDDFKTRGRKYPAMGALMTIGNPAVPYLIKAIKESESALVRTNAAHTLGAMYAPCGRGAVAKLEAAAAKPNITREQKSRLHAARDYIVDFHRSCKSPASSQ